MPATASVSQSSPSAVKLSAALHQIPIDAVLESADNPRKHFDDAHLAQMTLSMGEVGQLTPCTVRPHPKRDGYYELAAGASRLRAARAAGFTTLECYVKPMADAAFLETLTFENLQRRDLLPMEEARAYAVLQKRLEGFTVERIAERSGVSPDYVRDRLRLLRLSPTAVALLEAHRIQLSHALELAKIDLKAQERVIKHGLFHHFDGQHSALLDLKDVSVDAAVPVTALKRYIDEHVRIDLTHPELPHLLPATAKALRAAHAEKTKVVLIAFGYVQPDAKGTEPILGPGSWKRADGAHKSKPCAHGVLGVVAAGDAARGTAFTVCLNKKKCAIHWPDHVKREAARARGETPAPAGRMGGAGKAQAQLEKAQAADRRAEAERTARRERMDAALPAVAAAFAAAVNKRKVLSLLDDLIAEQVRSVYSPSDKKVLALLPDGKTAEAKIRRLYWVSLVGDGTFQPYGLEERAPRLAKEFGVDLKKILAAAAPKPPSPAAKKARKAR